MQEDEQAADCDVAGRQGLNRARAQICLPVRVGVAPAIGFAEQPFEPSATARERAVPMQRGAKRIRDRARGSLVAERSAHSRALPHCAIATEIEPTVR